LGRRLDEIHAANLHRQLRPLASPQGTRVQLEGVELRNFSSNDYLGLGNAPELRAAAIRAVERYGAGAGASRLICGSLGVYHELDEALAAFKGTPAALSFSTGYTAAVGAITALMGKEDVIVLDKLVHACIVDAARLSGAKLRVFAHNDLNELADILRWADQRRPGDAAGSARRSRTLVVTESVFSMDGDLAPLRELVALKEQHGAWLMVDEAHATGLYGPRRRGLAEELGVADRIELQMGTLGKALGAAGGYLCGSARLRDYLINRARSFIFSTAPVPAAAGAAAAGVRLVQSHLGEARRARLWERVRQLRQALANLTSQAAAEATDSGLSAIIPFVIGDEAMAMRVSAALRERSCFVPAVRYPTVARGTARLRITLTADHSPEDLDYLVGALRATLAGGCTTSS
jgi:8-amino-7-oxononanoate synthase